MVIAVAILSLLLVAIRKILLIIGGEPNEVRSAVQAVAQGRIRREFAIKALKRVFMVQCSR